MKVGITARFLSRGDCGNKTYLINLIKGISKYDRKNEYIIFTKYPVDKDIIDIKSANIKFITIDSNKYGFKSDWDWDCSFNITDEFRREKPDVLHITHFVIPKIKQDANHSSIDNGRTGPRIVTSVHDLIPSRMFRLKPFIEMGMPFDQMSLTGLRLRIKEPSMIKNTDHIIAFSEHVKGDIIRFFSYPEDKISVIPHFPSEEFRLLDITEDRSTRIKLQSIMSKFNLPPRFLAYFSGYHKRKNIDRLVKAFEKIVSNLPDMHLVFIGKGRLMDKIKNRHLRNIHFTGKVNKDELVSIINLSEMTIAPSLYEGFGLWLVESMKCGKVCLTSKRAPMEDIGGDATLYFNPVDIDDIANTILKVLTNRNIKREFEKKMSIRANLFKEDTHIKETISIYERLSHGDGLH